MSRHSDEEVLIRKYLLGALDETRQEEVEERLLHDDDFADRLYATQDTLIDDYAFDLLPEDDRDRFEKNFTLSDDRRKKLLFAQTMESYLSIEEPREREDARPPSRWWKNLLLFPMEYKAWLAAALATIVFSILLMPKIVDWLKPTDQPEVSRDRAEIEQRIVELNKKPFDAKTQAQPALELTLQPTLLREGGEMEKATPDSEIENLKLRLVLPRERYESYRAVVRTIEGRDLFALKEMRPEPGAEEALLIIPSEFLPAGDYQIELKGIVAEGEPEGAAVYNFRIGK